MEEEWGVRHASNWLWICYRVAIHRLSSFALNRQVRLRGCLEPCSTLRELFIYYHLLVTFLHTCTVSFIFITIDSHRIYIPDWLCIITHNTYYIHTFIPYILLLLVVTTWYGTDTRTNPAQVGSLGLREQCKMVEIVHSGREESEGNGAVLWVG